MDKTLKKILYVHMHPPYSPWVNSGASRAICLELMRRNLLWGAIAPDVVSSMFIHNPGYVCQLALRIAEKLPDKFTNRPYWQTERDGSLGRALKQLPSGSSVIYVFGIPEIDRSLDIKRYLFLNLSLYDAIRENVWGHGELNELEISDKDKDQRRMLASVDGVITPSTYAAYSLHRDFGVPMSKITPFGYGSTLGVPGVSPIQKPKLQTPKILFSGRDWERKNGPLIFEAFLAVRDVYSDAELWIVGPTKNPVSYPGVRFFGFIDKTSTKGMNVLRKVYQEATVFCMPTGCEPWGIALTEAVSFGLPIVGLRSWSLPDIVEEGKTGRLVDGASSAELARELIAIHENPETLLEMSKAARHRYATVLDWRHCVARILTRVMPEAISNEKITLMQ